VIVVIVRAGWRSTISHGEEEDEATEPDLQTATATGETRRKISVTEQAEKKMRREEGKKKKPNVLKRHKKIAKLQKRDWMCRVKMVPIESKESTDRWALGGKAGVTVATSIQTEGS
jgi:hypothetical protein